MFQESSCADGERGLKDSVEMSGEQASGLKLDSWMPKTLGGFEPEEKKMKATQLPGKAHNMAATGGVSHGSGSVTPENSQAFLNLLNGSGLVEMDRNSLYHDKNLSKLLNQIWEKGSEDGLRDPQDIITGLPDPGPGLTGPGAIGNRKRKSSALDGPADSTDSEVDPLTPGSRGSSSNMNKPSQRNVLLAQLLAKRTATETVINTQLTISANAVPQAKLPKNISTKGMDISKFRTGSTSSESDHPSSSTGLRMKADSNNKSDNMWDRADLSIFPGLNVKDLGNVKVKSEASQMPYQSLSINTSLGNLDLLNSIGMSSSLFGSVGDLSSATNSGKASLAGGIIGDLDAILAANNTTSGGNDQLADILQTSMEMQEGIGDNVTATSPGEDPLISQIEKAINANTMSMTELDALLSITSSVVTQPNPPQTPNAPQAPNAGRFIQKDLSEQMAIDAIQNELMRMDSVVATDGDTMATNTALMTGGGLDHLRDLSEQVGSRTSNASALLSSAVLKSSNGRVLGQAGVGQTASGLVGDLQRTGMSRQSINVRQTLQQQLQQAQLHQLNIGRCRPRLPGPQGK